MYKTWKDGEERKHGRARSEDEDSQCGRITLTAGALAPTWSTSKILYRTVNLHRPRVFQVASNATDDAMNAISRPTRRLLRLTPRHIFQSSSPHRCQPLAGPRKPHWRNLHSSHRRLAEEAETERAETQKIDQPEFFKLYKDASM